MIPKSSQRCSQQAFLKGFDIIVQGEVGDEFFVIQSGEASVKVHTPEGTKVVATLHAGDYFGEKALLASDPRSATITAETYVECLSINRKDFNALGLGKKEDASRKERARQALFTAVVDLTDPATRRSTTLPAFNLRVLARVVAQPAVFKVQEAAQVQVSYPELEHMQEWCSEQCGQFADSRCSTECEVSFYKCYAFADYESHEHVWEECKTLMEQTYTKHDFHLRKVSTSNASGPALSLNSSLPLPALHRVTEQELTGLQKRCGDGCAGETPRDTLRCRAGCEAGALESCMSQKGC